MNRTDLSLLQTFNRLATAGMFIWAGYLEALSAAQQEGFDDQTLPAGQIDIASEIARTFPLVELAVSEELEDVQGPGVWEYDVAEPLGKWIFTFVRESGELPESQLITNQARQMTQDWAAERSHARAAV